MRNTVTIHSRYIFKPVDRHQVMVFKIQEYILVNVSVTEIYDGQSSAMLAQR